MHVIINTGSMIPIYEQIMDSIKKKIVSGELKAGDPLPSVRALSAELRISALTVKKAYDGLERDGFTATVHGKGTYVTAGNTEMMAEQQRREIEKELETAVQKGRSFGMSSEELRQLLDLILEDE
jgi:GntR family transcriptional regulator